MEMSAVQANADTEEREYETLDTFQDELHQAPPVPEYDYVYIRPRTPFATSIAAKSFELTECVAYNSVTGRP